MQTNPVSLNLLAEPEQEIHAELPEPEPMRLPIILDPTKMQEDKQVKLEMLDNSLPPGFFLVNPSPAKEVTFDNSRGLKPMETPDWDNSKFEIKSPIYGAGYSPRDKPSPGTPDVGKVLLFEEERPPSFSDNQNSTMKINRARATQVQQVPSRLDTKVFEFESNHHKHKVIPKGLLSSSSMREEAGFSPIRDETQEVQFRDSKSLEKLRNLERLHGQHKAGKVFPSYDSLAAPEPQSAIEGFGADYSHFEQTETHSARSKPSISRFTA